MSLNPDLLVAIHCYAGDRQQVVNFLPQFEHHEAPIVIVSPEDSQVHNVGPHICRCAGKRAYIGQDSWDRQHLQLKLLLDYPQQWFLLNDADSFVLSPKLPDYLFRDKNTVWSNEVEDFRIHDSRWGPKFHWPLEPIAMQPPYFLHRNALEKIVAATPGMVACTTTPFIDWWWVPACDKAHVKHARYTGCASCETETDLGRAVMKECILLRNATFVHSIKRTDSRDLCVAAYKQAHP